MQTITLQIPTGGEFTARFAPFTGERMDKLERAAVGYHDAMLEAETLLSIVKDNPEILDTDEALAKAKPILRGFLEGKADEGESKNKLLKLIGKSSPEQRAKNTLCWRRFIQIMILETTLTNEELSFVQSDIEGEFWAYQDAFLVKSAGEFFRSKVAEYTA